MKKAIAVCTLCALLLSAFPLPSAAAPGDVVVRVNTYAELAAAAADPNCEVIEVMEDIVLNAQIALTHSVSIQGNGFTVSVPVPGLLDSGVLNTADNISAFRAFAATAPQTSISLSNLKIIGGRMEGGGIYVAGGATVSLDRVTITRSGGGQSIPGGGINNAGTIYIRNSQINRNAARHGGGFLNTGTMVIENSSFSENRSLSSGGGGGAGENQGKLYINNCTFSNNKSTELGGAINDYKGMAYIMNSTFTGNVAYGSSNGGALRGSASIAVNCLFGYNYHLNNDSYTVNDISNWGSGTIGSTAPITARLIGSVFHDAALRGKGLSMTYYGGAGDGSDDTLFAGGTRTKVLAADGSQTGSELIYQPYLHTPEGGYSSMVPVKAPLPAVLGGGVRTLFDPYAKAPLIAYYNDFSDPANPQWSHLDVDSNTWSWFAPTPEQLLKEVNTDQAGNPRDEGVVGGSATSADDLYMIKLLHKADQAHGTVHGVTVYGDVYESGDRVTLIATPHDGYYFKEWVEEYTDSADQIQTVPLSAQNPYRFAVSRDISLYPTYSTQPTRPQTATELQGAAISPTLIDLDNPLSNRTVTASATLKDSAGNPLGGQPVTFYILNSAGRIVFEKTLDTGADGAVSFAGGNGWTATASGAYRGLIAYTGDADYIAASAEESIVVQAQTYAINYQLGENGSSSIPLPRTGICDTAVYVAAPVRVGYTFTGWKVEGVDLANARYGSGANPSSPFAGEDTVCFFGPGSGIYFKNLTDNGGAVTLTAQWSVNSYRLQYDHNGGSAGGSEPASSAYDAAFTIANPTHPQGLPFAGWTVEGGDYAVAEYGQASPNASIPDNTQLCASLPGQTAVSFQNLTGVDGATVKLTARWMQPFTLTLALDSAPRTGLAVTLQNASNTYALTAAPNAGVYLSTAVPDGVYDIYYDGVKSNEQARLPVGTSALALDYFTVTFHPNGGTPAPAPQQVVSGGKVGSVSVNRPYGDQVNFDGWYTSPTYAGDKWVFASTPVTGTTDLYARWLSTVSEMTAFSIARTESGTPVGASGVISGSDVTVTLPAGTDLTSLVAEFTLSPGAEAKIYNPSSYRYEPQESGTTTNSFVDQRTYRVYSEAGAGWSKDYSVQVLSAPDIATTSLQSGSVGSPYSAILAANGSGPFTWGIAAGSSLPSWLSLNASTGALSATSAVAGTYAFTVQVTTSQGSDTQALTLSVLNQYTVTLTDSDPGITGLQVSTDGQAYSDYTGALTLEEGDDLWIKAILASGYTFEKWENGITANPYKIEDITRSLAFAPTSARTTYAISYDANGGSGAMDADRATAETPFVLPTCSFQAPAGKQFKEWAVGSADSAIRVAASGSHTFAAATTVYAVWEDQPPALAAPLITAQPGDQAVTSGQRAVFGVTATGNPAPTYQWQINRNGGRGWEDIPQATGASYTTGATELSESGYRYRCLAANSKGRATSEEALLTVTRVPVDPPPSANSITGITAGQVFALGDTVTFTANGGGVPNASPVTGDRWWLPTGWAIHLSGDFSGGFTQRVSTANMPAGPHTLTVTFARQRYDGTAWVSTGESDQKSISFAVVDAIQLAPPIFTSPAQEQIVEVALGQRVTFTVAAQNAASYQWWVERDGSHAPISGADGASYTLSAVTLADGGARYYCVAREEGGSADSPAFLLHVAEEAPVAPPDEEPAKPPVLTPVEPPAAVDTGDSIAPGLWAGALLAAGAGVAAAAARRRRRGQNS
ncbi:InlB B-repeat-containing protein [Bittarella massiliensis (ex Durand et al. 2017)]|uniref:InlB B-repeat-containing protein n=2 Tax=Clostridia TaxID=186801 RepID=UPI001AA12287|nr:InlB B-repeat-containing protein [Bittarella massiliensis (ex Durand et al. 2017)]MBO1679617.1 hypothetical protein [Bittarella massiliensis (ex Durand et al. 2017)]